MMTSRCPACLTDEIGGSCECGYLKTWPKECKGFKPSGEVCNAEVSGEVHICPYAQDAGLVKYCNCCADCRTLCCESI